MPVFPAEDDSDARMCGLNLLLSWEIDLCSILHICTLTDTDANRFATGPGRQLPAVNNMNQHTQSRTANSSRIVATKPGMASPLD